MQAVFKQVASNVALDIGQLAASAAIRTGLKFFLEGDLDNAARSDLASAGAPGAMA